MVPAREHSMNGGQIAILGAGSLGRLWAALLPSGECGFLPRLASIEGAGDQAERTRQPRNFSRQESLSETRCEYILVRSASLNSVRKRESISRPWLSYVENVGLLLVTTKAGDTLSALSDWLPHISEDTPIVLFQNGDRKSVV